MAIMLGSLYKALLAPNEDNARRAAEEVAGYESRLASLNTKMTVMQILLFINIITCSLSLLWQLP